MKPQIHKTILWTLLPALLWTALTLARPWTLTPRCISSPTACTPDTVLQIDRFSLSMEEGWAEELSYLTQNFSGVLALLFPFLLYFLRWKTSQPPLTKRMKVLGQDLVFILQVMCWNGVFTEVSHWLSKRPRPFVYMHPEILGVNPSNYTSFYSGHTSFAAAVNMASLLILWQTRMPRTLFWIFAFLLEGLVISTASFRVLAGRHFFTDVLCGALAGTAVAWAVASFHGRLSKHPL